MGSGVPAGMFPNSSRAACATAETGFHSANTRNGVGKSSVGTKVLAMKVSGKITSEEALLMASTLPTDRPT